MTREELELRIAKKEEEIAKTEKLLGKYLNDASREEILVIGEFFKTGDRSLHRPFGYTDAWGKATALYDARETLAKYKKQLEAVEAKENTFANMPEVLKQFRDNLIEKWDRFDEWKREEIKKDYSKFSSNNDSWKVAYMEMNNKWGRGWYDFRYLTNEQIHKLNVTAADSLVLNLLDRTVDLTGTITDCAGLIIDQDNAGYSIINGVVIGEKGKARVESIGAGGYNIQRYHIRVLVKEVR